MEKKLLGIFAHPDDESFGPGGTIAKYTQAGVEVHLLCAARGEVGEKNSKPSTRVFNPEAQAEGFKVPAWVEASACACPHADRSAGRQSLKLGGIREREFYKAAKVLGIARVEFLGAKDGEICNKIYHCLAEKIEKKLTEFAPQVVITHDRLGVSGHLDHIGLSMITTYAFLKAKVAQKLYYHCLPKSQTRESDDYFVYFPQGYKDDEITTVVDTESVWHIKVLAMECHKSQWHDVVRIKKFYAKFPKKEYFILGQTIGVEPRLAESDLFSGTWLTFAKKVLL